MKTALQVTSWIAVVIGVLAIFGGFGTTVEGVFAIVDPYALFGGLLFASQGVLSLIYIAHKEN